jgi:transcription-repair coupling factor (superfamily II helicase)
MPESVDNLFEYARLRKAAENARIISIDKTKEGLAIKLGENAKISPEKLMDFLSKNETAVFSPNGILRVEIKTENLIEAARLVLEEIKT